MAANKYLLGSTVYLVASAGYGSLEPFCIMAMRQRPDGIWCYKFSVPPRSPIGVGTIGDRITKQRSYDFELLEEELTTLCDALGIAEAYLQGQLVKIRALRTQHCGTA